MIQPFSHVFFSICFNEEIKPEIQAAGERWSEFNRILQEMNAFRKHYLTNSSTLLGEIKTGTMDANDDYFMNSISTYEWASVVQRLLEAYANISRAESTKKSLIGKLDEGMETLTSNQAKLNETLQSLGVLTNRKTALKSQFDIRFDQNRKFIVDKLEKLLAAERDADDVPIHPLEKQAMQLLWHKMQSIKQVGDNLKHRLGEMKDDIDGTEAKIRDEIETVEHLKEKIASLKAVLDSDSDLGEDHLATALQNLIAECEKYRERHYIKHDLI